MRKLIINLFVLLMIFAAISCTAESYIFTYQTTEDVTLLDSDGTAVSSVVSIQDGKTATSRPVVLDEDGKIWAVVWYADSKYSELYVFDTPIHDVTTIYGKLYDGCVKITADSDFYEDNYYFKASGGWTYLEYSLNYGYNWTEYKSGDSITVTDSLLLRGVGNTVIVGETLYVPEKTQGGAQVMKPVSSPLGETTDGGAWSITDGTNSIPFACEGDIRTLLDYKDVRDGNTVEIGDYAFANMFADTQVTFIPDLSQVSVFGKGAFENTFNGCYKLIVSTTKPVSEPYVQFECNGYPAEDYCKNMFKGCRQSDFNATYYTEKNSTPVTGTTYYFSDGSNAPC